MGSREMTKLERKCRNAWFEVYPSKYITSSDIYQLPIWYFNEKANEEISDWIDENVTGNWFINLTVGNFVVVGFEKEEEAIAFKLKWC